MESYLFTKEIKKKIIGKKKKKKKKIVATPAIP